MKQFATSIVIRAPAATVWRLLTDASEYPRWNSTVEKVDGRIAAGESLKVYTKAMSGRAFPLTVTELVAPRRMVWSGGMPLGLFTGARTYTLDERAGGQVAFGMREEFTGLLAPLITRNIPDLQPSFDQFAADLKRAAESLR